MAVVTILKTGKTKDMLLAKIARNIFMLAATLDIFLRFTHIAGIENTIADILSRWQGSEENKTLYLFQVVGQKFFLKTVY